MVFGKKKKPVEPEGEAGILDASIKGQTSKKQKQEQIDISEIIGIAESTKVSLLEAILGELKLLREDIKETTEEGE